MLHSGKKGLVILVNATERKRPPLVANLGDFSRPVRVRPVRYLNIEWWAIDSEDTWPGMVMDLRRLGFESTAYGDEVLVREPELLYEPQMEGPNAPDGLKPFPKLQPSIRIHRTAPVQLSDFAYLDEEDEEAQEPIGTQLEPEDLDDRF